MSYRVQLYVVVAKDNNNSGTSVTPQQVQSFVQALNARWAPFGIEFLFDTGDLEVVQDTALRDDKTPGDDWANARARSLVAARHLGKIVFFVRDPPPAGRGISTYFSGSGDFVVSTPDLSDNALAHELGHFFNLSHTMMVFELQPGDENLTTNQQIDRLRARMAASIRTYVASGGSRTDGLNAFDADRPRVADTPPDAGPTIFALINNGNANGPTGTFAIDVDFQDGTPPRTYSLNPDRTNFLSYFGDHRSLSGDQQRIVVAGIENGNRRHLIEGKGWAENVDNHRGFSPAVVSWGRGRIDLFARGADGHVYNKVWEPSRWWPSDTGWSDLGGQVAGCPVTVSWGRDRIDLFALGTDGHIYNKVWEPSRWWPGQTDWSDLGGSFVASPAAVSWGPRRIDLFALGTDGHIYNKVWEPSRWWPGQTDWSDLGGPFTGTPTAVSWAPGRIDLFARGADGRARNKVWEPSRWWPSQTSWTDLGGPVVGTPTAVSWGYGRVDLFARGTDGNVYNKVWEPSRWWPGQTDWDNIGTPQSQSPSVAGGIVGPPAVASWGPGRVDAFVRGADGHVYNKVWEPSRWWPGQTEWQDVGPAGSGNIDNVIGLPVPIAWASDQIWLFARALDGSVIHKQWNSHGGWSPSQSQWLNVGFPM